MSTPDEKEKGREAETITFHLRNQKDERDEANCTYRLEASSKEAKLIALANEMGIVVVWRFDSGPFNPCQGGDEDDVAYVPTTARTPSFVDHPVFGCCRIVVYDVFDADDELIGSLYIGMHA